jgi:gluconokinase
MPEAIVIMGVSGAGKSTLGRALAAALRCPFIEGDELHPPANIAKMSAGIALNDADRIPFLEAVGRTLAEHRAQGLEVVVSCSALKRAYRDRIRARAGAVTFVLPVLDRASLLGRLQQRPGHFMPAALLDSQLQDLERPQPDEAALLIDGNATPDTQLAAVLAALERSAQPCRT